MDWNTVENYNNELRYEVNIEKGVLLPDVNKAIVFVRSSDNKAFIGKMVISGLFEHHEFVFLCEHWGDVGVNSNNINGTKWCYLDL